MIKIRLTFNSIWRLVYGSIFFFKDGIVTVDEFKQAVQNSCIGRRYEDFPQAMKAFIETNFRMIDINCDGIIGLEEYRYDCVQRMVVDDIKAIDEAFNSLLNVSLIKSSSVLHSLCIFKSSRGA